MVAQGLERLKESVRAFEQNNVVLKKQIIDLVALGSREKIEVVQAKKAPIRKTLGQMKELCIGIQRIYNVSRGVLPSKRDFTTMKSRFETIMERIEHRLSVMLSELDEPTRGNCASDHVLIERLFEALVREYPELK